MQKQNLTKRILVAGIGLGLLVNTSACNLDKHTYVSNYDKVNKTATYEEGLLFFKDKYKFKIVEHRVIGRDTVNNILNFYRKKNLRKGIEDNVSDFSIRKEILRELNDGIQFTNLPINETILVPYNFQKTNEELYIKITKYIDNF